MKECKNGRSKLYTMDGAKLAKIFEKKSINARRFGKELNFHETYFPKCIRTNKIGEKAIGLLMANGIMPSQYGVEDVFEAKEKKDSEIVGPLKRNSGRYPFGEDNIEELAKKAASADEAPVEKAMNEPGVVKVEFTLDIVKLKAIIKQAVKEAYEEL